MSHSRANLRAQVEILYKLPSLVHYSSTIPLSLIVISKVVVQFSCSVVSDFATPWTAAHQASLSITNSWNLLKIMSFESVMPSNRLILCHPLLLPPSIFPSIRVFSNESVLYIRWPKYRSFSFGISPWMNIQDWFPLGLTGLISLVSKALKSLLQHHSSASLVFQIHESPSKRKLS